MNKQVLILGAGPAGLSCAHGLCGLGVKPQIWDRNEVVGGLCRTTSFKGFRFDVGPHRFFTRNDEVDALWHAVTGEDVLSVDRLTRILYRNHLFRYPLQPVDALRGLGFATSFKAAWAYVWQHLKPRKANPAHFEEWVVQQFGRTLYQIFFKTYTEKVWGIPCNTIAAEWATQRIKGLNLGKALIHGLLPILNRQGRVKSLVDQFDYPRLGAGQAYENMSAQVEKRGGSILLNTTAHVIHHDGRRIRRVEGAAPSGPVGCEVDHLFSSIPLTEFVLKMQPAPPEDVLNAARTLYYRDHITVNLIVTRPAVFPDNWIYVHSPEVRMARISSYGNFSPYMLADAGKSAIAVEYFVFAHEDLWQTADAKLIELATQELIRVGLLRDGDVADGFVQREKDAYPAYFTTYRRHLDVVKQYVSQIQNATLIGRGGMYRYNNQDHSILCGLLAARNFGGHRYDLWEINEEQEYLEEKQLPPTVHAGKPGDVGTP